MSEPITPAELAELRRLSEAATPGPWQANRAGSWCGREFVVAEQYVHRDGEDVAIAADVSDPTTGLMSEDNARLIAAARNALPRLLDEIERLRAELAKRPKLWVVRYPNGLHVDGLVHVGDCGSPTECIAAFDRKTDADYVAGCIGGTVEEWGAK